MQDEAVERLRQALAVGVRIGWGGGGGLNPDGTTKAPHAKMAEAAKALVSALRGRGADGDAAEAQALEEKYAAA